MSDVAVQENKVNVVDTHIHVFVRSLKLAPVRRYTLGYDATVEDYFTRAAAAGITHAVLVQPSFLGTDNSYMCAVLRAHRSRLRGIAVVDPNISETELDTLQDAGVVGIRLNLDSLPIPAFDQGPWPRLLSSLTRRNWQVEVHREATDLPRLVAPLVQAGVAVVVDHFGRPDAALGADDAGFRYLLEEATTRRVWVKLSAAYRNGAQGRGTANTPETARLLLAHFGPDRLVWGSDWPHTRHESDIHISATRQALDEWVPDPAQRMRILSDTALTLFRF